VGALKSVGAKMEHPQETPKIEKHCRVKVVVNSNVKQTAFTMRVSPDTKTILIKFTIKSVNELHSLVEYVDRVLQPRYCWTLDWSWTNVPKQIEQDVSFRNKVLKMFASVKTLTFNYTSSLPVNDAPPTIQIDPMSTGGSFYRPPSFRRGQGTSSDRRGGSSRFNLSVPTLPTPALPAPAPSAPPSRDALAASLANHIRSYRAAPDLSDLNLNIKKRFKAINFVRSVLGRPNMSDEEAQLIAEKANALLVPPVTEVAAGL
jgi:hypothetical protein